MESLTCMECENRIEGNPDVCPVCGCRLGKSATSTIRPSTPLRPVAAEASESDPFAQTFPSVKLHFSTELGQRVVELHCDHVLQVGREVGPMADLCTDNISAFHAEIAVRSNGVEIRDTGRDLGGSTNGTFIDGSRLAPNVWTPLCEGTVVRLGTDPPITIRLSQVNGC